MFMKNVQTKIASVVKKAKKDKDILAVLLFGSRVKNEAHENSDIDVCLVLHPGKYENIVLTDKRLEYSAGYDLEMDIQVYQQLPLYIRKRVLENHKILYCKKDSELYEIAFKTLDEFGHMEKFYEEYYKEVLTSSDQKVKVGSRLQPASVRHGGR